MDPRAFNDDSFRPGGPEVFRLFVAVQVWLRLAEDARKEREIGAPRDVVGSVIEYAR
jgi:hypothetical protein